MKTRLTLTEEIKPFFDTEDKEIWELILDNKIEELLATLPREDSDNEILDIILKELFTSKESEELASYDFTIIKESNSALFKDLIRLIFALDISEKHDDIRELVTDKLLDVIPDIVNGIKGEAKDYPRKPISALVWMEGAGMRSCLNSLIYYYKVKEDIEILHTLIILRTQITLAIMSHYKNLVGPDMIESAQIKEKIGQSDVAKAFYNGVKSDFEGELKWFIDTPEAGANEDDVIILNSLKEAYLSLDRLENTNEFAEPCKLIDEILEREYFEPENYEEEEEDDDEE